MNELIMLIKESGAVGYLLAFLGIVSFILIIERARCLYFQFNMKVDAFSQQVRSLIHEDRIEEAITVCGQHPQKPLAQALKVILERADRDEDSVYQAQDIALSENLPKYSKRLGFLSMLANVSTLFGLLGTIQGLIMAFHAVSTADPAAKQVLLAEGISVAMYTTALGLMVAIPTMMAYAFLQSKQNNLSEVMIEQTNKIIESLNSRKFKPVNRETAYPTNMGQSSFSTPSAPPPTNVKM